MEEYDVSIIIPVYNCEKYLVDCVKSIQNEDYENLDRVQVILVDDGSTDNSLDICYKLKENIKEFSIDVLTGENQGVSVARNKGIKVAKGKYIMFIDSDDFISKEAIRKLVEFFDIHYEEVDIIKYPIYNYYEGKKTKRKLPKYKDYTKGTAIYDLDGEDYYILQTTMNIMVKNLYNDNVLFDENMKLHEDTKYSLTIIMNKKKIGYVDEARYYYRMHKGQTTGEKNNPYYCFNDIINFFEYCIENYTKPDGHIYNYVQAIMINVFRWRVLQDKLFPYFYEGEQYKEAIAKIKNIIKKIDNEIIIKDRYIDQYHKMFFISIKDEKVSVHKSFFKTYSINDKNGNILSYEDKIEIVVNKFKFKNNKVKMLGFLKSPLLRYEKPKLFFEYVDSEGNTYEKELQIYDNTVTSKYKTKIEVAKFYRFEYEFDIANINMFKFNVEFLNDRCKISYYLNNLTPFNSKIGNFKVYSDKYRIQYKNNMFLVSIPSKETIKNDFKNCLNIYNKINKKINYFRILAKITKNKNSKIWLYNDRKNVFDNAYIQFKHDYKYKDEIKKYYILDGKKKDYIDKFSKEELKHVIEFGSIKHKLLFLNCDKILTSFSSIQEYCPLHKNYQYYKDILNYDLIYLQHGILHANLTKMYSNMISPIDKFVVSSQFECDNLIKNYEYSEEDLIPVGMPRLDEDEECGEIQNKIIFAPSWREYLIGKNIKRKREINRDKFINSKYYVEIVEFLTDDRLRKILKEKNLILDFKLHPIFTDYADCFENIKNENIDISVGSVNLKEYKLFITDFSSFQFDFVKLNRPIIYFMPDMPEFKAGLHTYRELDLSYDDAFGKLCLTGKDLVEELLRIINNDFLADDIYKERMENFFYKVDNRKDKLYRILKEDNN